MTEIEIIRSNLQEYIVNYTLNLLTFYHELILVFLEQKTAKLNKTGL